MLDDVGRQKKFPGLRLVGQCGKVGNFGVGICMDESVEFPLKIHQR